MSAREALLRGYRRGLGVRPKKKKRKVASLSQKEILRLKALAARRVY